MCVCVFVCVFVCVCVCVFVCVCVCVCVCVQSVIDLRGLMEEVLTLKAEREVIERTLRENVADISKSASVVRVLYLPPTPPPAHSLTTRALTHHPAGKFLQALKDYGDVDEEAISEAHLRTEYGSVQSQVHTAGIGLCVEYSENRVMCGIQ